MCMQNTFFGGWQDQNYQLEQQMIHFVLAVDLNWIYVLLENTVEYKMVDRTKTII